MFEKKLLFIYFKETFGMFLNFIPQFIILFLSFALIAATFLALRILK